MNDSRYWMVQAMLAYGGQFVKALARCYEAADDENAAKLDAAFPEYVATYGPRGEAMQQRDKLTPTEAA